MTKTNNNLYTIKDVSEITGVHAQTLRNWEKDELIEPIRVAGNQRIYTDQHVERIYEILDLKEEGLRLKGIRNVLLGKSKGFKRKQTASNNKGNKQPIMSAAQTLERPTRKRKTKVTRQRQTETPKYREEDLQKMTLKDLIAIAREEGVKYFRQMFKDELVIAIANPSRRDEMREQAKERTKRRYGHKVYGERARRQGDTVQYAQAQARTVSSQVADERNLEEEGLVEANVVEDANEELDSQQLLIQQILNLGEEGKSPEEIAKKLTEAYK